MHWRKNHYVSWRYPYLWSKLDGYTIILRKIRPGHFFVCDACCLSPHVSESWWADIYFLGEETYSSSTSVKQMFILPTLHSWWFRHLYISWDISQLPVGVWSAGCWSRWDGRVAGSGWWPHYLVSKLKWKTLLYISWELWQKFFFLHVDQTWTVNWLKFPSLHKG